MAKINLPSIFSIAGINANFQLIANELNNRVLYRSNPVGEANAIQSTDIDYNGNNIMNANQVRATRLFLNGVEVVANDLILDTALKIANNLSDVANPASARFNIGLGNVDNTSDLNKPISTATSSALALKAPLASPAFTGTATFTARPVFAAATPWDSLNLSGPAVVGGTLAQFSPTTSAQLAGVITDETGSGALVFNSSPALTSPVITGGTINNTPIGATNPQTGQFTTLVATTGGLTVNAGGASITGGIIVPTGAITPNQTSGITGTTTNNNAVAGAWGEYQSNVTTGISISSGTGFNATSISLTAGDWDVSGVVTYIPAASTVINSQAAGISTTSATLPAGSIGAFNLLAATLGTGAAQAYPSPTVRVSLASTTTVYLIGQAFFTVSTCTANGAIRARRVR